MNGIVTVDIAIKSNFNSDLYQLDEKIGEGGFGQIYKAVQTSTQQVVAIKFLTLNADFDIDKKRRYIERFHRESDLIRRLNHPNIVQLIDKGQQNDSLLYAVYEYIDGYSLKEHLDSQGPLNPNDAAEIMACVLDALSHAHEQGVIHRDIKPANIMLYKVGAKMQVKVLDFGIGTLKNEARQLDYKSITLTQETLGTPSYSAPEQLRGEPPVVQTDIYVWGLVFLECLTATPTITGSSLAAIFHQQLSPANVPLGVLAGHSSAHFFRRVLNKKAHERPKNTAELYHDFQRLNFTNLVGDLSTAPNIIHQNIVNNDIVSSNNDETLIYEAHFSYSRLSERKQISVLSVILTTETTQADQDIIETFHRDQMQQCIDIAIRYGAYHVGSLAGTLLFYFGYPNVTDNDSRLCSRTALDIVSNINKKNALLKKSQGIHTQIKMGMQIGLMLSLSNNVPDGKIALDAMQLCRQAKTGQILCSEHVKQLLGGYLHFDAYIHSESDSDKKAHPLQDTFLLREERIVEAFGFLRGTQKNSAFIGREQTLITLQNVLTAQQHRLAHIHGEAGIGKSRLVFELRNNNQHLRHFVAQCLPEHSNNALYPILNLVKLKYSLDSLSTSASIKRLTTTLLATELNQGAQELGLLVLSAWLNYPLPEVNLATNLSPEQQKQNLFTVITALLCLTDTEPHQNIYEQAGNNQQCHFLFILEDIHWSDPTSKDFIAHLVQSKAFKNAGHSWCNTSREVLPNILVEQSFQLLPLNKLDESSSMEFINSLFSQQPLSEALLKVLVERTDGIPLFIEELASTLQTDKLVHKVNGTFDFVDSESQQQIPATLRESLQHKLDQLIQGKETAQLAATIGREFDYDLLVAASDKEESQVQSDLDQLISTDLVYLHRKVNGDSYIFKHALVRDAAYSSMTTKFKIQQHQSIALILETTFNDIASNNPEYIARHFSSANLYVKAVQFGILSIINLAKKSRYEEALLISETMKPWLLKILDVEHRIQARLQFNNTLIPIIRMSNGWAYKDLKTLSKENLRLLKELHFIKGESLDLANTQDIKYKAEWTLFTFHHYKGERKRARYLGEKLLKKIIQEKDRVKELMVSTTLGQAYFFDGDFAMAHSLLERVIENYRKKEDLQLSIEYGFDPYHFSAGNLMSIAAIQGNLDEAITYRDLCLDHAIQTNNMPTILTAYTWGTCYYYLTYDIQGMSHWCNLARIKHENKFEKDWILKYFNMNLDWSNNKYQRSSQTVIEEIESGQEGILSWYDPLLSDTYQKHGMHQAAITLMEASLARTIKNDDKCILPIIYRHLAIAIYAKSSKLCQRSHTFFLQAISEAKSRKSTWLEFISIYELIKRMPEGSEKKELLNRATNLHSSLSKNKTSTPALDEFKVFYLNNLTF